MVATNPALAGRIQGFGNSNPPPVEDETAKTVAKRVANNLGGMLGEEVMLTVQDFKEKGAVGAVKDAVADAGDILIDGVAGVFGWIRGDPPPEEEDDSETAQSAANVLAQGPSGAAYGVSQASPTGGINAVWVMPDEADPAQLAELARQAKPSGPSNIQPYVAQNPMSIPGGPTIQPYQPNGAVHLPGGPTIQPYVPSSKQIPGGPAIQPYVPAGPGQRPAPFVPGGQFGLQQGFNVPKPSDGSSGRRGFVESIAKGDITAGPQSAKRFLSMCTSTKVTGKQAAELICERARRLYLGLDDSCGADTDSAIMRLLTLIDALAQESSPVGKEAAAEAASGISEELLSLQSNAKHRAAAEPMLQRIGILKGATTTTTTTTTTTASMDLLGAAEPSTPQNVDLLGGLITESSNAPATTTSNDLLL